MALLETRDMSVTFGGLRAVNEVNFTVEHGQLVGLITRADVLAALVED